MTHPAHRWLISVGLGAIALCGCHATAPILSAAERDAVQTQVRAALDSLTDAWRRVDVDGVMHFYLDSALLGHGGTLSSASDLRTAWARLRPRVSSQQIGPFQPIRFDVLSRDIVVVSWVNNFTVVDAGGHARPERIAANTYVWVRNDGASRLLTAHESTRLANDSAR